MPSTRPYAIPITLALVAVTLATTQLVTGEGPSSRPQAKLRTSDASAADDKNDAIGSAVLPECPALRGAGPEGALSEFGLRNRPHSECPLCARVNKPQSPQTPTESGRPDEAGDAKPAAGTEPNDTPTVAETTGLDVLETATADAAACSDVRYDGRGFREWHAELMTELKPERRLPAVAALGAFGTNGYAREAAVALATVLDAYPAAADEFLHSSGLYSDAEREVVQAAMANLMRIGAIDQQALLSAARTTQRCGRYASLSLLLSFHEVRGDQSVMDADDRAEEIARLMLQCHPSLTDEAVALLDSRSSLAPETCAAVLAAVTRAGSRPGLAESSRLLLNFVSKAAQLRSTAMALLELWSSPTSDGKSEHRDGDTPQP